MSELKRAHSTIKVQAYSFTSEKIADALIEAHNRHVAVEVILDKSRTTEKKSQADRLAKAGIPTKIDANRGKAHNKVMVIDGSVV